MCIELLDRTLGNTAIGLWVYELRSEIEVAKIADREAWGTAVGTGVESPWGSGAIVRESLATVDP